MDEIDLEMEQMLRHASGKKEYREIQEEDRDKINSFIELYRGLPTKPLGTVVNRVINVKAVDINLMRGGFTIFTDSSILYGTSLDNCAIQLESFLSRQKEGISYHNKDGWGRYLYMFPDSLAMSVRLKGKFLKRYEFEVCS